MFPEIYGVVRSHQISQQIHDSNRLKPGPQQEKESAFRERGGRPLQAEAGKHSEPQMTRAGGVERQAGPEAEQGTWNTRNPAMRPVSAAVAT